MSFKKHFGAYVCEGDSVTCTVGHFTATATIYRDDSSDAPDERQDGFWPSLDPKDAGYIGPRSKRTLARHRGKAQSIMDAWKRDDWFYCGVAMTIEACGTQLTAKYDNALWGVECNYPGSRNTYLRDVANELLPEAIDEARAKLEGLRAA